ncbi:DNA methyltransferase [Corynebacterium casei]|uniref:DNA methyltransferase n=1 Tax=Corynebacterium casei TaxID=160386 RepID=UPI003FD517FD
MNQDIVDNNENVNANTFDVERMKLVLPEFFDREGNFLMKKFKDTLTADEVSFHNEGYRLDFVGKSFASYLASTDTETVIVPDIEHNNSEDKKNSENLYIVGDNLDALKHLKKSYEGKIKCIYIDPPYNTGKDDFGYPDTFKFTEEDLIEKVGLSEEEAERTLRLHGKASHSAWLSFMLPRLKLAKDLLHRDGLIFISIDDNEQPNLSVLCDEVFGESNRMSILTWDIGAGTQAGHFTRSTESILVYARNKHTLRHFRGEEGVITDRATKKISNKNPASEITFPAGMRWDAPDGTELAGTWGGTEKTTLVSGRMIAEGGKLKNDVTLSAGWAMARQTKSWLAGNETFDSKGQVVSEFFFNRNGALRYEKVRSTSHPSSLLSNRGTTKEGTEAVENLFGASVFSFPKPPSLIQFLLSLNTDDGDIVLDFFSGSASTAHAVMVENAINNRGLRFIMVQLPEDLDPKSKSDSAKNAYDLGYRTIDEIGRDRIIRAANKIKEETGADMDYGFKLFRLEEPSTPSLRTIEKFNPDKELFLTTDDYLDQLSTDTATGEDIVLTTWMNQDNYTLTPDVTRYTLDSYELPVAGKTAYIVEPGFTNGDVVKLVEKLEKNEIPINRLVYLPYTVEFHIKTALINNLKQLKSDKTIDIIGRR